MEEYKEDEGLLDGYASSQELEILRHTKANESPPIRKRHFLPHPYESLLLVVSLSLHALSAGLILVLWSRLSSGLAENTVTLASITGLQYDQPIEYLHNTNYWSINESLADELWDALPTDSMVVAVPDSWADEHGLARSGRWPWDELRGRYFVQGLHELHCLKYVRHYVVELERGRGHLMAGAHAGHCLDMLRQTIMCRADDSLQQTSDTLNFTIGDHQVKQCRSFDRLLEWSRAPERHACHRILNDYKTIRHGIERYAFCPDDSPYKAVQEAYFIEHGHVDPWV